MYLTVFSTRGGVMPTGRWSHVVSCVIPMVLWATLFAWTPVSAQGLGGAGTVQGTVKDPSGGVMVAVTVTISNAVTGFTRSTTTDATGKFVLRNLAPNNYHVEVTAQGFQTLGRDVEVRTGVPL